MRFAYADPPYPGQSERHYGDHPDFDGEVDHTELLDRLATYDGWVLHTSTPALRDVLTLDGLEDTRLLAWVKPFAAFKANVKVAYAWEPIIAKPMRPAEPNRLDLTMRDWYAEPITMKKGLTGAKPERLCHWIFEVCGLDPIDEFDDLFPGTGAVSDAWGTWTRQLGLDPEPRAA